MNEQPNQILLEIKNPFKKNVVKLREKKCWKTASPGGDFIIYTLFQL